MIISTFINLVIYCYRYLINDFDKKLLKITSLKYFLKCYHPKTVVEKK